MDTYIEAGGAFSQAFSQVSRDAGFHPWTNAALPDPLQTVNNLCSAAVIVHNEPRVLSNGATLLGEIALDRREDFLKRYYYEVVSSTEHGLCINREFRIDRGGDHHQIHGRVPVRPRFGLVMDRDGREEF